MNPDSVPSASFAPHHAIPLRVPVQKPAGWAKDDPVEHEFLDDLARMRREDLDRTLREYDQEDH